MSLEDIKKRWESTLLHESPNLFVNGKIINLREDFDKLIAYAEACNAYFDSAYHEGSIEYHEIMERVKAARKELEK